MGIGVIKAGNFRNGKHVPVRDFRTVSKHLKYIGFRSREIVPGQERFFSGKDDYADWKKFYEGVRSHKALQHSSTVKIHKVMFSLRKHDYEAYVKSGRDYKDIIRSVLKEYEHRKGVKLEWIAARHDQNSHPHCHVVIRAVTQEGPDGKSKRVYLSKEDIQKMKRDFDNEVARHRMIEKERSPEEKERTHLEKQFERSAGRSFEPASSNSFLTMFDQFAKAMEQERQKREYEIEREKQRDQR
ncbi:hypothetical protein J6TS7_32170 [Paenibacillus dendritiformis]|uniref:relaxase/mobilization nuclease domain-containing protein n=1 Tax=Paenibacillus TaxID=44249 RepID=UPI001B1C45B9|nr:hypothetical protein [Paenibacillus dendritiformis]GIO79607.1 hypothetical protein J6TS7_32170 [Paenibacillus dendritiformis]